MKRARSLCLLALAGFAAPAPLSPLVRQEPDTFRISVNVDLVVLHATVRDRQGGRVSGLSARDFAVYEDGVRQTVRLFRHEDAPVTVGLVVDHSGSMAQKLPDVIAAARTFARSSNPADEMFVVNFNEHVSFGMPAPLAFTNSPDILAGAIATAPATGKTALYDAVLAAAQRSQSGAHDKRVLVVISDGGDNASAQTLDALLKTVAQSSVIVYAIGIFGEDDPDKNPKVLKRLAEPTGGEAHFPLQLSEVVAVCEQIAYDIRHQYTLGYVPANSARDGAYRTVRVSAATQSAGKLVVRARTGYVAGDKPARR